MRFFGLALILSACAIGAFRQDHLFYYTATSESGFTISAPRLWTVEVPSILLFGLGLDFVWNSILSLFRKTKSTA